MPKKSPKRFAAAAQAYRIRPSAPKQRRVVKNDKKPAPPHVKPIPTTRQLVKQSVAFFRQHQKSLLGVLVVYAVLYTLLVSGFGSGFNISQLRESLVTTFGKHELVNNILLTGLAALGAGSPASDSAKVYQAILPFVGSLAMIWAIRQLHREKTIKIRDAYYLSMQPTVPFVLVLLNLGVKLIPLLAGGYLFATVQSLGVAASLLEKILLGLLWLVLGGWSLYMAVPSILALYAVTLPGIYPLHAIRACRELVAGQRAKVLGRISAGILVGLLVGGVVLFIAVAWLPAVVVPLSLLLGLVGLLALHLYLYEVYRSLV